MFSDIRIGLISVGVYQENARRSILEEMTNTNILEMAKSHLPLSHVVQYVWVEATFYEMYE